MFQDAQDVGAAVTLSESAIHLDTLFKAAFSADENLSISTLGFWDALKAADKYGMPLVASRLSVAIL